MCARSSDYASLCVIVLVTSGSPQHIRLLDTASTNIKIVEKTAGVVDAAFASASGGQTGDLSQ